MGYYARTEANCSITKSIILQTLQMNLLAFVASEPPRQWKGEKHEKNLSTQEKTKKQSTRFPRKNEDHRWQKNACKTQK